MWELDHKESWVQKNWCSWTVVLVKTIESLLNCKEIKAVNPKGNQSGIFIGRIDAEAEAQLWPPDVKKWLIGKDPDAGKDWRQEEKGMTEDKMVQWHHCLDGHEFEQAPGVGDGQGSGVTKSWTWLSDWTKLMKTIQLKPGMTWMGFVHTNWSILCMLMTVLPYGRLYQCLILSLSTLYF